MTNNPPKLQLKDRFGRVVDYVRISVTDRCDYRCVYCMSERMEFLPRSDILSLEELQIITQAFVELGVSRIRITGGEPLVRKGVVSLLAKIGKLPGLDELLITTNGSHLAEYAESLKESGVSRINVSLDSLDKVRFKEMTRVGDLDTVLNGIDTAISKGFQRIKINTVVLRNRNHQEVLDLVKFAIRKGIDISFIEEMPLGHIDEHDRYEAFYSSDELKQDIERFFVLTPLAEKTGGPSRYYKVGETTSRVGFISPHSHNFCGDCNRVRVTAEGRLLLCLGNEHSVDLRQSLRSNGHNLGALKGILIESMNLKPERHHFDLKEQPVIFRHMSVTGG